MANARSSAGEFDERVFQGLDWVIAEAGKRRLRVMLTLVNYWSAYGGMPQYVRLIARPLVVDCQAKIVLLLHCAELCI